MNNFVDNTQQISFNQSTYNKQIEIEDDILNVDYEFSNINDNENQDGIKF